jgi:uncharacterized protein
MENKFDYLLAMATSHMNPNDPSHDPEHIRRVMNNAIYIANQEGGDQEIILPGSAFHDLVTYPKTDPRNATATDESAELAKQILESDTFLNFPSTKIKDVVACIRECSWSKNQAPSCLESAIIQDADRLESTGLISLLRTFASSGKMNRGFYNPKDPFREKFIPQKTEFGLDLLYTRLFKMPDYMNTKTGKGIAARRNESLKWFELELKNELQESGVYN